DVFDRLMPNTDLVEMRCRGIQFVLAAEPERDVVKPAAILVEAVPGDRPQPQQRAAEVVDDTAEQEAELGARGRGGVLARVEQHRPTEHALVELPGSLDVRHGQPNMRDGGTG